MSNNSLIPHKNNFILKIKDFFNNLIKNDKNKNKYNIENIKLEENITNSQKIETKNNFSEQLNMEYEKTIEHLTARVDAVLDYIEQNPESDPNAYEMMDLTIQVANVGYKVKSDGEARGLDNTHGYEYAIHHEALTNLRRKYFSIMDKRLKDMEEDKNGLGLNEDSMLYKYLSKSRDDMVTYNPLTADGDTQAREAKCKLAGVALYTKQRKRDLQRDGKSEVIYDNSAELEQIREYYKGHNPSLYEEVLLDEIERCYDKKFEPKQTVIQGLESLVKSDEEIVQTYGTETTVPHTERTVEEQYIQ